MLGPSSLHPFQVVIVFLVPQMKYDVYRFSTPCWVSDITLLLKQFAAEGGPQAA